MIWPGEMYHGMGSKCVNSQASLLDMTSVPNTVGHLTLSSWSIVFNLLCQNCPTLKEKSLRGTFWGYNLIYVLPYNVEHKFWSTLSIQTQEIFAVNYSDPGGSS